MFESVSPKLDVNKMELAILKFWKDQSIFERVSEMREGGPEYVFYEGPPTANGKPGVHHGLARAFKDLFPRYRVMRGDHVIRRGGWDTHGLPVEIEVERKLGFTNKQQIEDYGIDKFNELCRQSAFEYILEWERFTDRLGFWVDFDTAYITYENEYIESVWYILKSFWEKDLLYQGYKVVPYCPRCGTPLSDHEVSQGYADAEDPSIFVRFPLVDEPGTSMLVWTTTPWTLPGNVAVAAHPDEEYVKIERQSNENGTERLILGKALLEKVFGDEEVKVLETFKGKKLKGLRYQPLFTFLPVEKPAYYVVLQNYVTMDDGTGLVHTAPAFGGEDMNAAMEFDLPVLMTVKEDGTFIQEVRPWSGKFVKDADPEIIQDLENRGLMFRVGSYTHTYPFCWRCDTPLLYYARGTWFIRTSSLKERLLAHNQEVNWVPDHIKDGRFGNWLENNIDWSLGRERYWGTPLPVWECQECHNQDCMGSVAELSEKTGLDLSELDLHRPHVDNITYACEECGGRMQRVPELIDVWFDSGAMPYAQWHAPFENQEIFEQQFPADFICEAVDQTRGWFYSLHAIASLHMDSVCFKNVICLGHILAEDGLKMSKSRGTAVEPWDVFDNHGADAFRWYLYTASPPGNARKFSAQLVEDVVKNFTLTLWNVYSFFVTYAKLDGWQPGETDDLEYNSLDLWLRSSLHALVRDVTEAMENYDVPGCTRPVEEFVNTLSKWYLRRSRRRFWKGDSDADKNAAYATLYEALTVLSKLLAPTMPFLAEELYQNLVRTVDPDAMDSVHMADWPEFNPDVIDHQLNQEMALVLRLVSLGHAARNKAEIKVRQPLAGIAFSVGSAQEARVILSYADVFAEELNVKQVGVLGAAGEAVDYRINPLPRQLGSKYQQKFPAIRKALLAMDASEVAAKLLDEQPVEVLVEGETYSILPDEVEVQAEAKSGLTVAQEGAYLAALSTELTPELVSEGMAREFVRRVQDFRKQSDLEISDRIKLYFQASENLTGIVEEHSAYIMGETLSVEMVPQKPPEGALTHEEPFRFEGEEVILGIVVAE
ncbi:MAG: isoleucine--tRNA ligase [Anaerolineales bacterium]|nr:isoleucine--tRNA ligase [Anaerolineales bacterium]